ncbi:MAG TPA: TonB-dependent receptor [Rhodanobacteraceae bacterium]|nr:TonB-dependent receptor [Rhodanobacteraceae bacterium]
MKSKRYLTHRALPKRNALVVALALGMGISGLAYGQATTGTIFGTAPAGDTVVVTSSSGASRTVSVSADGRYTASNLPVGVYTISVQRDGEVVSSRGNVSIRVGAGTEVDFGSAGTTELGAVMVSANALPSIDVSTATSGITVTAAQLDKLPLGHSANAIALLAPGVVRSSGYFGDAITVNGSGATENAYYVNGYNTTQIYNYTGPGYQLPYGSIGQQQIITGGYGAKYGRADGGVISQIGKRGTNEWHFGGLITWKPRALSASPKNLYYPNIDLTGTEQLASDQVFPGDLRSYRSEDKSWETTYAAYIGGPLIKDKLFFFVSAEQEMDQNKNVQGGKLATRVEYSKTHDLRWYGKIDWNINDSNILQYTKLKQDTRSGYGPIYQWDAPTLTEGDFIANDSYNQYSLDTDIFQYTSYISDKATLNIIYGDTDVHNPTLVGAPSSAAFISGGSRQNPAYLGGGGPRRGPQVNTVINSPLANVHSRGLRVDFTYRIGDHSLMAGIDNMWFTAGEQGRRLSGPGYWWVYGKGDPNEAINPGLDVGAPGGQGYYVDRFTFNTVTSMSATQKAWYIQDNWQITQNVQLMLGLRNDDFTNSNALGEAFVVQKDQWEPRLGFTWDVFGDSSFKVYGTAGRYYLALPQATGERAAGGSYNTDEYFTYTGIDANGVPTGLSPVPTVGGSPAGPGEVSANNERGQFVDPKSVTSTNLKPQYQDEFILGFDKQLGSDWVYGAKLTYRTLGTVIDDECDAARVQTKLEKMGYDSSKYLWDSPFCRIFNPNLTSQIKVNAIDGSSSVIVPMTREDWGDSATETFPDVQRDYYGVDLYLEHPFDGTWYGRVSYTFARSWGNAEGQVRSDIGQTDVSVTEDWDYWQLMSASRGYLANMRRHQLKAYGAWQVTPEWMVSGNVSIRSGMPESCLGYFGPNKTNPGGHYGPDYHWCEGEPSPPGQDFNPWTYNLDLGVQYRPSFADHKLKFRLDVFNVLNEERQLQSDPNRFSGPNTVSNTYHAGLFYQQPRTVRLTVSYDY